MNRRLLIATLLLLSAVTADAAERRVLFAINDDGDGPTVEPVVVLDPIGEPRVDDDFIRRYLGRGRRYTASFNGSETGDVRTLERVQSGCVSFAASVKLNGAEHAQFASNFTPRAAGTTPREATEDELRMLRRWARQFLVHRGVAAADAAKLEMHVAHVDPGDGVPIFVGSAYSNVYPQKRAGAVFFIAAAHEVTAARVSLRYARFSERDPDGNDGTQPLFGTIDLDRDGLAELVTHRTYKEGYAYIVYRRVRGRWIPIRGGGGGC